MNNKLLVICGPTATGKTKLALFLAKKFKGEIVSADSRQVYRHMDIGTGKEWGDSMIWGYDLIDPQDDYSVLNFFKFAKNTIEDIWLRDKMVILTGGTGLYIKSIIDGIATVDIPKNENLRKELERFDTNYLFEKLAILDSSKAATMNSSDKKNPRRLIRAIEIAVWNIDNSKKNKKIKKRKDVLNKSILPLMIGLTGDLESLRKKINQRVEERLNYGFIDEIEKLLLMGVSWKNQSMKSLGYKEAEYFLKKGMTYEEFVKNWENNEFKYLKRQLRWFKKDNRIKWFNISNKNLYKDVENTVKKWYYMPK